MVWWLTETARLELVEGVKRFTRYYSGVAIRLTTICCSALALITLLPCVSSAQARRVKQTYAADDHTPVALFPLQAIWTLPLNNSITATPAYDATRGYFPLEGDQLAAYDLTTGARLWLVAVNTTFEPAAGDGLVFVVRKGGLSALRASDGSSAWELPLAETVAVPPVWDNGWLFVATKSSEILAFRASDGTLLWRRNIGAPAHARPSPAGDFLYVPGGDSRVVALRVDTGATVWDRRLGGPANDILASGDRLYLGSQDKFFYCLSARDGSVEWRWQTGGPVIGLPSVDERTVYFVSLDNVLRALNKSSGVQRWKISLALRPATGPMRAAEALLVSGPTPALRAYKAVDGKSAGEFALPGELAAPPHIYTAPARSFPVLIAVARDIVKGVTVLALTRSFDPPVTPFTALPNLIQMNPTATPTGPSLPGSPTGTMPPLSR
jgi:outer membrane protein assembly factor BamB